MPLIPQQNPPYYTTEDTPIKTYIALLNQTGTNAPIPTIFNNTIGQIIWTRLSAGTYNGTLSNAFPITNTWMIIQIQNEPNFTSSQAISHVDQNTIRISTWDSTGAETDDILANTSIEITIYP